MDRMSVTEARDSHTSGTPERRTDEPGWTFLTNHAHVLVCLSADPDIRIRDVADRVGITERATQRIVHDLVEAGYVARARSGRRNSYRLILERPMRHPVEADHSVGTIVRALAGPALEG
jgi:DNA-binding IscR family transcriptional regulator